jgi:O-antigen ligase
MLQEIFESRATQVLVTALLAVPLALVITVTKPGMGEMIAIGMLVLLVAFLFPLMGLYLIVVSMLLGPEFEIAGQSLGSGATFSRGLTLRLDDFLMMLVGCAWLAKVALVRSGVQYLQTPLNRAIAYYLGASIFATLIGVILGRVSPFAGFFFVLKYYEYFFLYFMTVNLVTDEKQIKQLVTVSLVTCFLVSLYAIFQMANGERASAPFEGKEGEPNTLGGYLVFMLSIVTGLLMTPGASRNRVFHSLLLLCGFVALQATLSRSSFLAAGVVLLVFMVHISRRNPLLMTFVLLGLMAAPLWAPPAVKNRVMYTFTQSAREGEQYRIGGVRVDTSTTDRLRSWGQAVVAWKASPLWGYGVTGGPFMDAMYPKLLMDTGILGLVAFCVLMWSVYKLARSSLREIDDPYFRGIAAGFLLGFVGMLVHGIGANTFIIVRIMEPFWLYVALVAKALYLKQQLAVKEEELPARPLFIQRELPVGPVRV